MDWSRFNTQLRNAIDTGKVSLGTRESTKECLVGNPKLLIVSSTIKETNKKQLEYYAKLLNIPFIEYVENGFELGSVCGKPFSVSSLVVTDFGESSIIEVINQKGEVTKSSNSKVENKAKKKAKKEEKKAEKSKAKKLKEMKQKEEEKPLLEDKALEGIIKIKKR